MSVEGQNEGQKSALTQLRESIAKQQEQHEEAVKNDTIEREEKYSIMMEVPDVAEADEDGDFSLERFEQLAKKVDVLYHNYLVSKEQAIKASDNMANALKELAQGMKDIISEGFKTRF